MTLNYDQHQVIVESLQREHRILEAMPPCDYVECQKQRNVLRFLAGLLISNCLESEPDPKAKVAAA